MTGLWRRGFGLQPTASRIQRAGYFCENRKLRGVRVLRFVQNNVEVFFSQTTRRDGMLQQLIRESDLIWISDQAAFDPVIAEITLHFSGNPECGLRHPAAHRSDGLV